MSAQLAGHAVSANSFSAHLTLAAGVTVSVHAPSMHALRNVVAVLQPTEAANDAPAATGNSSAPVLGAALSPATTAAPADAPKPTAAAPTPAAETAAAPSQASTAAGDAGNANAAALQGGSSAPDASSQPSTASAATTGAGEPVSFDVLKKAFLALSTKAGGRTLCEGVLKPFNLGKLSEAKPEQYAAVLAEIQKASA